MDETCEGSAPSLLAAFCNEWSNIFPAPAVAELCTHASHPVGEHCRLLCSSDTDPDKTGLTAIWKATRQLPRAAGLAQHVWLQLHAK
mmetsp:Transcript_38201/g.85952  ORF Transcript_38201/g.85952 Transcript_38201/m.85952 type:complete len:87 (-) Transcript_38201:23-283(-)